MMDGWLGGWMDIWVETIPFSFQMPSPILYLVTYKKLAVLLCMPLIQKISDECKKRTNRSHIRIRLFHLPGPSHMQVLLPGRPSSSLHSQN